LEDVREHDRRVTEEAETAQRDVRIIYIFIIQNKTKKNIFFSPLAPNSFNRISKKCFTSY
jgi:hypothetical protein